MNKYIIRDECRRCLAVYSLRAYEVAAPPPEAMILDAGCGTGVAAIELSKRFGGTIFAIDKDRQQLNWLREKITIAGVGHRIKVIEGAFGEYVLPVDEFDVAIAEGC
jgi:ubiquinone/menaquinone biosynthesis C-methylase UbiE